MITVLKPLADKRGKIHNVGDKVSEKLFTERQLIRAKKSGLLGSPVKKLPLAPFKGNIKIAIITGVWKRPEVFKMFADGIDRIGKVKGVDVVTIISGSEGQRSKKMVTNRCFEYIEVPNKPLARKMNVTASKARDMKCTHVLCVGSDDIISPKLFKEYIKQIRKGYDFIGVLDFYFYDTVSKKAMYWGGYRESFRRGHTCGAGRVISARLLKEWNWKPWNNKDSLYLDNSMQSKLQNTGCNSYTFSLKEKGLYGLDIKSSTNMTPFKKWDNTKFIDAEIIKREFKI